MKEKLKWVLLGLWIIMVLVLGTYGYMLAFGGYFWQSLYSAVMLFGLNPGADMTEFNGYLTVAGFMASLTIATFLFTLLKYVRDRIQAAYFTLRTSRDKIAIHTDCVEELVPLLNDLKAKHIPYIISDVPGSFKNGRQFLFFSQYELMFEYITQHGEELRPNPNRDVYVYCEERDRDNFAARGLHNICLSQNAARIYWQEHRIEDAHASIVMIGFGNYGEALLEQALLSNVIATDSEISYHIFPLNEEEMARAKDFAAMHTGIRNFMQVVVGDAGEDAALNLATEKNMVADGSCREEADASLPEHKGRDLLWIHEKSFYACEDVLVASRVILCADQDETNIAIAGNLQRFFPVSISGEGRMDIRLEYEAVFTALLKDHQSENGGLLFDSSREQNSPLLTLWGNKEKCMTYDIIFSEKLLRNAKIRDASYRSGSGIPGSILARYGLTVSGIDAMSMFEIADSKWYQEIWNSMSGHMQGTNIALADHTHYKLWLISPDRKLKKDEIKEAWDALPEERQLELGEIEHMRWERFHYMNNWKYGPVKDFDKRTHPLLMPMKDIYKMYEDKPEELKRIVNNDLEAFWNLGTYLEE